VAGRKIGKTHARPQECSLKAAVAAARIIAVPFRAGILSAIAPAGRDSRAARCSKQLRCSNRRRVNAAFS